MSKYGDISGYEPTGQPGAIRFHTSKGPLTLIGRSAEELKSRVDAANTLTGGAGAEGGPTGGQGAIAGPRMGKTVTAEEAAAALGQAQGDVNAVGTGDAPEASVAENEAAPNPAPAPPAPREIGGLGQGRTAVVRGGGDPANSSDITVYEPPRAATKGGLQETGRTIRGGMEPDQDYLDQQTELAIDERLANQQAADAARQRVELENSYMEARAMELAAQEQEAANREQQAIAEAADKEARYDAAVAEYHSSKVDPDKYQKDNQFQFGAGAILGAIGNALTGDKTAINVLESQVDRNIKAQETAITIKRDRANNTLQDFQRKLGSREDAKTALKQAQLEQASNAMQLAAGKAKDPEIAAKYLAADTEIRKRLVELREDYRQKTLGETTRNLVMRQGSPGSPGGARTATIEEQNKILENEAKKADVAAKRAGVTKAQQEAAAGPAVKMSARQKAKINAIDTSIAGLDDMAQKNTGSFIISTGNALGTDTDQQVGRDAAALAPQIAEATGMKPEEVEKMLTTAFPGDRAKNIETLRKVAANRRRAIQDNPGGSGSEGGSE